MLFECSICEMNASNANWIFYLMRWKQNKVLQKYNLKHLYVIMSNWLKFRWCLTNQNFTPNYHYGIFFKRKWTSYQDHFHKRNYHIQTHLNVRLIMKFPWFPNAPKVPNISSRAKSNQIRSRAKLCIWNANSCPWLQ